MAIPLSRRRETGTILAEDRGGVMNYDLGVRSLSLPFCGWFSGWGVQKISIMCFWRWFDPIGYDISIIFPHAWLILKSGTIG